MRSSRWTLLALVLVFSPAAAAWSAPEDLEASGDDLELEGSGSGAEEIPDEKAPPLSSSSANKDRSAPEIVLQEQEVEPWDRELTVIQESKSFMENKEVFTGVIAGGVGGLVLAVLLGALLVYKWQKKEAPVGYVRGHSQEPPSGLSGTLRGRDVVLV